eukprot:CAMPEP_0201870268 /NCGR_PEP_ID=MMETSP0902-20130614/3431_1 /ASSEMBLY_ACC=CAM_ASM_000551 /TAXON_ID=420261 /ORGANISM="Thalassiosira antarctica, Strain CCMP982" /LENGTH=373 /DNA_ID=CAMNT_0048395855 /DNA_START=94 /DNA_END=1215 /DNA_ORIENTATION=+
MSYLPEPPLKINRLNIGGIVFKLLGTISCIVAIRILIEVGNDPNTTNYEITSVFAFAVIADIIATPLTFAGAFSYMKQRHSSGIRGLVVASWIIYALQISFGLTIIVAIGVVAVRVEEDVPTGLIVFYLFWTIVGWISMFVHAERARGSLPIFYTTIFNRPIEVFIYLFSIFNTTASPPHEYSCITSTRGQATTGNADAESGSYTDLPFASIANTNASPPQVGGSSTVHPTIPIASVVASVIPTLPAGWEEATAENGRRYYYNIATSQTSWQAPTVQCPPPPPPLDEGPRPPPRNPTTWAPPTFPSIETSGAHGSGNYSLVGNGPANNSTVTKTYSNDGTVTVREERSYPDGSTTVSVTVTTRPNASDVSASV